MALISVDVSIILKYIIIQLYFRFVLAREKHKSEISLKQPTAFV